MAFTEYKNLATVLKEFSLPYQEQLLEHDTALQAPANLTAEMYTAVQLNENAAIQVFGIVSNGKF